MMEGGKQEKCFNQVNIFCFFCAAKSFGQIYSLVSNVGALRGEIPRI